jgi:hypothetical protein
MARAHYYKKHSFLARQFDGKAVGFSEQLPFLASSEWCVMALVTVAWHAFCKEL